MGVFGEYNKEEALADHVNMRLEVRNKNVIPRLKAQRDELQNRIVKIDKLLNVLEKNPEFVQVIDLSRELL